VSGDRTLFAGAAYACAGHESYRGNLHMEKRQSEQADYGRQPSLRGNVPFWIVPIHTKSRAYPGNHTPGWASWMLPAQKINLGQVLIMIGSSHRLGRFLT